MSYDHLLPSDVTTREIQIAQRFFLEGSSECLRRVGDELALADGRRPSIVFPDVTPGEVTVLVRALQVFRERCRPPRGQLTNEAMAACDELFKALDALERAPGWRCDPEAACRAV